jgi:carbon monoxide dehydrogenase subunit G
MSDLSYFESRQGKVTCTAEELFYFVTNIRNFEQFVPQNTINNWHAEKESCSFSVSMIGTVEVKLSEKTEFNRVVFNGDALKKNDFSLILNITDSGNTPAAVMVSLEADLSPMLKMMAAKPIGQFLEMLINQMESFRGWKVVRG